MDKNALTYVKRGGGSTDSERNGLSPKVPKPFSKQNIFLVIFGIPTQNFPLLFLILPC